MCLSLSLTPRQPSSTLPHPGDVRTSPSGSITGCTSPAAQGHIYDPFGPCLLPLIGREVTAVLLWPQCCPPVLTSPTRCAAKQAHHPSLPSILPSGQGQKDPRERKKILKFPLQLELLSLSSDDFCLAPTLEQSQLSADFIHDIQDFQLLLNANISQLH